MSLCKSCLPYIYPESDLYESGCVQAPWLYNFYHAQLSTKFILLINVKMPTIVGILTFIIMINTTYEKFKAINFFICPYFRFMIS